VCGMVALQSDGTCIVYFIDIFDIVQFIEAVFSGSARVSYNKGG
jgi:hypothetical protein